MSKTLTTYRMTIETLTPVHIGTGTVLLNNYDFKVDGGKTYRLHVDRVLDYLWPEDVDAMPEAQRENLLRTPPGELLTAKDLQEHPELVLYVMAGAPQVTGREAGQIREQIKDTFGRLYIPGSTIKGAIRTALARHLATAYLQGQYPLIVRRQDRRGEYVKTVADDDVDRFLFSPKSQKRDFASSFANYDLLRALRIADSRPRKVPPLLANVKVFRRGEPQSPVEVEAIPPGQKFTTTLWIDEFLLRDTVRSELEWNEERENVLREFVTICREHAIGQLNQEIVYLSKAQKLGHLVKIFDGLLKMLQQTPKSFLLNIGWAGGWENKTLGSEILAADKEKFYQLREDFRLGKPPGHKDEWTPSKEFPLSRRLAVDKAGRPAAPMGWVLVRLEKES